VTVRKLVSVVTVAALAAIVAGLAVGGTGDTNKKTFEYAVGLSTPRASTRRSRLASRTSCRRSARRRKSSASPSSYVHGDTHYFRVDKPLLDSNGMRLENFTRVETFGDNAANGLNDVHWVKALVDPKSRDVFAFQAQIVPANRTDVPAP
jgi:hypothetical protein